MSQHSTPRVAFILALMFLSVATVARGNVVGVDAQNFNAITSGLDFVTVQSSQTLAPCIFNLGLFGNYARNTLPLLRTNEATGDETQHHKDAVTGADLNVGFGLMRNWDIGLSLPQIVAQSVETKSLHGEFGQKGNTEVRLNTKYRLWGQRDYGVAVVGTLSINRITNNPYAGSGAGPTKTLEVAADTTVARVRMGVNVGYRLRSPGSKLPEFPIQPFKDQYIASAAASYHVRAINTKFIAEIFGSRPVKTVTADIDRTQSSAEALLGAKHDLTHNIALHLGGGTRLGNGVGSPDWRVYAGANMAFGPVCGHDDEDEDKPRHRKKPEGKPAAHEPAEQPEWLPQGTPPKQETIILNDVMFAFDSDKEVLPGTKQRIRELVAYMKQAPRYKTVSIEGHTDSIGSDAYNQNLSERRSSTIRRYLIEVHKLDPQTISAVGYGASQPIADNGNYQGRQRNRRVEFKITR